MTIKEALEVAKNEKIKIWNAKTLLKHLIKKECIFDLEQEISSEIFNEFCEKIIELKNGKPLQYITNKQSFFGEDFYVDENVLIPQPDTEILVEKALEIINKHLYNYDEIENKTANIEPKDKNCKNKKIKVLDLCTGSGAIAISLKQNSFNTEVFASDISQEALNVARKNADIILNNRKLKNTILESEFIENITSENTNPENENVENNNLNKIKFIQSDMFKNIEGKFDIIVSNPPYIKTDEIKLLEADVRSEPKLALDGGKDGLKFYKIIRKNIKKYLNDNGYLIMEIGYDQKEDVTKLFENSYCIKDYAGNDRVIVYKNANN